MKKKLGLLLATLLVASTAAFTACNLAGDNSSSEESTTSSVTTSSPADSSSVANTYTVTFDANGGSDVAAATVTENEKVTKPTDPTKTGYTFDGWYLGETAFDFENVAITTNVTLTAKWNVVTYTATVSEVGGTATPVEFTVENKAEKLAAIVAMLPQDDDQFDYEWSEALPTELALNDTQVFTYTKATKTYTITFVDGNGNTMKSGKVAYGEMPVAPTETPTKTATAQYTYTFKAWDSEISAVTGEKTYTATFNETVNNYTLTFETDGGTTIDPMTVPYGTPASELSKVTTTKTNYTFVKWQVKTGENTYEDIPATAKVETNMTLKAVWTATEYTVTVDKVEGDDVPVTFTVENRAAKLAEIAAMLEEDTAEWDYEWTNMPTELALENGQTITEGRMKQTYTVVWNNEDGTELETDESVEYGATPEYNGTTPTKAATAQYSYTFAGWTPDVAEVTGAATYTATYTPVVNKYTVTFDTNGGDALAEQELDYGTPVSMLSQVEATKEGYKFLGWTYANGETIPDDATLTEDVTVKAVWELAHAISIDIEDKDDFLNIGKDYTENEQKWLTYKLTTDLEFTTEDFVTEENTSVSINDRSKGAYVLKTMGAVLDGQGYKITVTYSNDTDTAISYPALFDTITGTVVNVQFVIDVNSLYEVGGLTRNLTGTMENCYVDAKLTSTSAAWGLPAYRQTLILNSTGVFNRNIVKMVANTKNRTNHSSALVIKFQNGTISNSTIVSNPTYNNNTNTQYISCSPGNFQENQDNVANGNPDEFRTNCYWFKSIDDLWGAGAGYMYNADGSVTEGTYADVKDLYKDTYWVMKKVIFEADGGVMSAETSVNVNNYAQVIQPDDPVKAGYTFDGWYVGEEKYNFNSEVTSDMTLVAKWTKRTDMTEIEIASKEDFLNIGKKSDGSAYTEEELKNIRYVLTTDLEFTTEDFVTEENTSVSINDRSKGAYVLKTMGAVLDGQGYKITVTYSNDTDTAISYPALFDTITGTVVNVQFVIDVNSLYEVGGLTRNLTGTMENCYVDAKLTSTSAAWGLPAYRQTLILNSTGVFNRNIVKMVANTKNRTNHSSALVIKFQNGTISNSTIVSNPTYNNNTNTQYISCSPGNFQENQDNVASGNPDEFRTNCYWFKSIENLQSGIGYIYNADGSVTEGTYANVKDLYTGTYWTAWLAV